jgi:hypothetical protein
MTPPPKKVVTAWFVFDFVVVLFLACLFWFGPFSPRFVCRPYLVLPFLVSGLALELGGLWAGGRGEGGLWSVCTWCGCFFFCLLIAATLLVNHTKELAAWTLLTRRKHKFHRHHLGQKRL